MDDSRLSISAAQLHARLGVARAPVVVDVRRAVEFGADAAMLIGAIRRVPHGVECWRDTLDESVPVVVYCSHGGDVSQNVAVALREAGIDASYLDGGIAAWIAHGLPTRNKLVATAKWVTREHPKIDRIACPWLVRRFVDPAAEFLYVPTVEVFETAKRVGATAFDIPGAQPFSHVGEACTFDAFIDVFGIADPALQALAQIVRGADTGCHQLTPQSAGLLAISLGLSAIHMRDDQAMLESGMLVYDALYAWCNVAREERHGWVPR